jgi:methanogenic corrinoid protein MtbC1
MLAQTAARYLEHLLHGDRRACRALVQQLVADRTPARELYEGLFQSALYEIGDRWQRGEVSVAVEHLATAITEEMLGLVFPSALDRPPLGRTAVVSCAADEYHQVGGRIVADTLEAAGWDVAFVGANVPEAELMALLRERRPDLVAISVSIRAHLPTALQAAAQAHAILPRARVIVGGQALLGQGGEELQLPRGVHHLATLADLDTLTRDWNARP